MLLGDIYVTFQIQTPAPPSSGGHQAARGPSFRQGLTQELTTRERSAASVWAWLTLPDAWPPCPCFRPHLASHHPTSSTQPSPADGGWGETGTLTCVTQVRADPTNAPSSSQRPEHYQLGLCVHGGAEDGEPIADPFRLWGAAEDYLPRVIFA